MERNRKLWAISLVVLGVLAVGLQAQPANAQVIEGKFTLLSEVRWGLATLPAGDYSFRLDRSDMDGLVTVYRGPRPVAKVLPQASFDPESKRAVIVVKAGIVRELSLPQTGVGLSFAAHKPSHRATPEEEQLAQIIPVAAANAGR